MNVFVFECRNLMNSGKRASTEMVLVLVHVGWI